MSGVFAGICEKATPCVFQWNVWSGRWVSNDNPYKALNDFWGTDVSGEV